MPRPCFLRLTLLTAILTAAPLAAAVAPRFDHASVEMGLSQATVQAIVQDHLGFVWLGTQEGLNRFDGYDFVVFKHDPKNPESLCDDVVCSLFEDRLGRLWIGTEHGLSLFDRRTETFSRESPIKERVTSIVQTADGAVWVASEGDGLYVLRSGEKDFVSFQPKAGDPQSLASFALSALLVDHWGRLWIGTRNAGLDLFEPNGQFGRFIQHQHVAGDPPSVSSGVFGGLAEVGGGKSWAATYGGGLEMLDTKTGRFMHHVHTEGIDSGSPTNLITSVIVDHSGRLWAGSDGFGLLQYDKTTNRFLGYSHVRGDPDSLSDNVVRSFYEDRQGHLWIGTYQGGCDIMKAGRLEFGYITREESDPTSLSDRQVASVIEGTDGTIWAGTEGGWLNRLGRGGGATMHYRFPQGAPAGSAILALHQDRSGQIWLGTYLGGLAQFDPTTSSFRNRYVHNPKDPRTINNDEVWSIVEDSAGFLWLGTNDGLDYFDPGKGVVIRHVDDSGVGGVKLGGVRALHIDRRGNLWIGTFGGLYELIPGQTNLLRFHHSDADPSSLSNDSVAAIEEDAKGSLWIGTLGGGINRMTPSGKFEAFHNFPSNSILGIEEDSTARLWLSTNQGLVCFTPASRQMENFNLSNGLQSLQFHMGASSRTRSGRILFGSVDGMYNFDPREIRPSDFAPPITLTAFKVFNQPVKLAVALPDIDKLKLEAKDKIFSFEFAALDYTFPRHNRYSYRMEGFDEGWIDMGQKREVTFTNLDPGSYVFRVRASNSDGVWTPSSVAHLNLVIEPPFWGTWWFRLGVVAAIGSLVVLGDRIRINRLTASIRERKLVLDALKESEDRYRRFFEEDLSGIFICDYSGQILDCNIAFARMFGFDSIAQATNENLLDLLPKPANWPEFRDRFKTKESATGYELVMVGRHGRSVQVIANTVGRVDASGSITELTGYVIDITLIKKLELQLLQSQKMEAIGQLAGGVAHDFNNLLTAIIGNCDLLLLNTKPNESSYGGLTQINEASHRAAGLTRQLLAFARKQAFEPKIIELNELVGGIEKMLQRLLGESVYLTIDQKESVCIKADPGQIEQVIMNLAINARDAMPRGGSLRIEIIRQIIGDAGTSGPTGLKPGEYGCLTVRDTGTGLSPEAREHLFEPFFTTKEVGKGTGLGLSTVYGIVTQNAGHIEVESELNEGTIFRVFFHAEPKGSVPVKQSKAKVALPRGTGKILLAEDSDVVRSTTRQVLADGGYDVVLARDAGEALIYCDKHPGEVDLLISDVVMPGMDGIELAERLKKRFPRLRILLISGYPDQAASRHGGLDRDAFLEKPFDAHQLLSKVREIFLTSQ